MTAFAQALLQICNEEQSSVSVEAIRNAAFAQMAGGNVTTLISTTINSKSFNLTVNKPADQLFTETTWAITMYNKGIITTETFDFSFI